MSRGQAPDRCFDGIICIGGEDWWYHNRGHFDFQIMRRLAHRLPVLFVNSIGVRMPSVGDRRLFLARIGRKLKSLRNGLVRVENAFWVFSPFMVPGPIGQRLSGWAAGAQIRRAALRAGIRRPLLWVHCPAGAELLGAFDAAATVFQRTDLFEANPEADARLLGEQVGRLLGESDLVVYCAPHLLEEEKRRVRHGLLVTHGVDLDAFAAAGRARIEPPLLAGLPRPRIGFVGGIDEHTFDPPLFLEVARRLPQCHFVLVGGSSLPEGWCTLENVKMTGRRPYEEVPALMAAMDVLIMPWNKSEWIKACNPIKLKEYLAVGRPVVTRDFAALDGWRDLVRVADTAEDFEREIRAGLRETRDQSAIVARLASETWEAKANVVLAELDRITSGRAHVSGKKAA